MLGIKWNIVYVLTNSKLVENPVTTTTTWLQDLVVSIFIFSIRKMLHSC